MADDLKKIIREQAHGLGFDAVGFADAEADPKDALATVARATWPG